LKVASQGGFGMSWKTEVLKIVGEFVDILGPWPTVVLVTAVVLILLMYKFKNDRALDRGFEAALRSKETTIERMAAENRTQRRIILSLQGHSNEQIEFLLGEKVKNGKEKED
jgi:predicted PurR-regulated permease PerM